MEDEDGKFPPSKEEAYVNKKKGRGDGMGEKRSRINFGEIKW